MDNFVTNFEIDIINFIANDSQIAKLLPVESVYPLFTNDINKTSLTYDFTPISSANINCTQLKVKIISKTYKECKEIEGAIRNLMDMRKTKSYVPIGETYFHSTLSGGGCLYNDEYKMYEDSLIFIINWRVK